MHLSDMAICLMDSDKAIGGLYLDADDFLRTGFLCHSHSRLSGWKRGELPPLSPDWQSLLLSAWIWDWQTDGRYKLFINAAKRRSDPSLSWTAPCAWGTGSRLSWGLRKMEKYCNVSDLAPHQPKSTAATPERSPVKWAGMKIVFVLDIIQHMTFNTYTSTNKAILQSIAVLLTSFRPGGADKHAASILRAQGFPA